VGGPAAAARRAAADTVIWNQRACIASLVHYVESDEAGALRYAEALRDALAAADAVAPAAPSPAAAGWIQRLRRGTLAGSRWLPVGGAGRDLRAAVVLVPGPFDLGQHPLSRVVMVRRVDRLEEAVALCHRGVSTAGVYPEARRLALRDALAARGVSNVLPLGGCERAWAGMPHDGMRVLADLVDWVNA
jgi:Acyl-CoA reductase (LuxC)